MSWRQRANAHLVALGLLIGLLLAGCANVLQGDPPADSAPGAPGSPTYDYLTGAEDVLISISGPDGLMPPDGLPGRHTTEFLLLGDGTAIVPAAVDLSFPGPAIYPLQSASFDEEQVQELFAAAAAVGLVGDQVDFGIPAVIEASSTNVTIVGGDTMAYVPTAVIAFGSSLQTAQPDALGQEPQPWPIASMPTVPATSDSGLNICLIVTGTEVTVLLAALAKANELTPWLIGADPPTTMQFRPFLPGEPGCEYGRCWAARNS